MADDKKTEFVVRDGGDHTNFETGSKRSSAKGKGRFDLVPAYPYRRLAQHYENGSAVYGDRNWEKGQPLMRYICSAESHMSDLKSGDKVEDHCSAIVWNIFGFIHTLNEIEAGRLPATLDDRPERMKGEDYTKVLEALGKGTPSIIPAEPAKPEMIVETIHGVPLHVTAYLAGGCCVCGNHERDKLTYAHDNCWKRVMTIPWAQYTDYSKRIDRADREKK